MKQCCDKEIHPCQYIQETKTVMCLSHASSGMITCSLISAYFRNKRVTLHTLVLSFQLDKLNFPEEAYTDRSRPVWEEEWVLINTTWT